MLTMRTSFVKNKVDDNGFSTESLCNLCVGFWGSFDYWTFAFIHALTNVTDDHKYSPFPSRDFAISGVLVSFSAFIFLENKAQEMTPKLLALAKVCSVLGNIRYVSWHLSKREK